jgi:hypothetical protein
MNSTAAKQTLAGDEYIAQLGVQTRWQIRFAPFIATGFISVFVIAAALSVWDKSSTWDEHSI